MERFTSKKIDQETGRTPTQDRTRAIALALAQPDTTQPDGEVIKASFAEIVDRVRLTDPAFDYREDNEISVAQNAKVRWNLTANLRRFINVVGRGEKHKYSRLDISFSDQLFSDIQAIYPDRTLEASDLYEILRIQPAAKKVITEYNKLSPIKYTPPPPTGPGIGAQEIDVISFLDNLRQRPTPRFIGNPGSGYVEPVSEIPQTDRDSTV